MSANKNISSKHGHDKKLKSYAEVDSFNRLTDKDSQTASAITAGGDKSLINRDINGSFHQE